MQLAVAKAQNRCGSLCSGKRHCVRRSLLRRCNKLSNETIVVRRVLLAMSKACE